MPEDPHIDVWICRLDAGDRHLANWRRLLSTDEVERCNRFVFQHDRQKFIAARGQLRQILARYVEIKPELLQFGYATHGKPYLPARINDIHFNLSHSSFLAAIAVSRVKEVGIDIEEIRPIKEDIAKRFFSEAENEGLGRLPPDDRLRGFYNVWTRKEALIKALGSGLSTPLDSFDVSVDDREEVRVRGACADLQNGESWIISGFRPYPGFVGSLAVRAESRRMDVKFLTRQ